MSIADHANLIDNVVMVLRIIVCALVFGLITFIGICAVIGPKAAQPALNPPGVPANGNLPVLTVTAFLAAAIILPLSLARPGILGDSLRKKLAAAKPLEGKSMGDIPGLVAIYQTKTIMAAALSEGPAFLAAIAYLIEGNPIALALAVLLTGFVAIRFPMRGRVEFWLEGQLDRLQDERRAASFS